MKRLIAFTAAVAIWGLVHPPDTRADDLFQLFWRGTYYTKDSTGHIIAVPFTEQDFVNQIAQNNNLDPSTLVFVFRPNKRDTAVVRLSDGGFVADVIQFDYQDSTQGYTDVVNPSGSVVVRHALLFDEAHQLALGSFFGLELRSLGPNGGLQNDQLVGTVLYGKPELGIVYGASVKTGRRIVDTSGG